MSLKMKEEKKEPIEFKPNSWKILCTWKNQQRKQQQTKCNEIKYMCVDYMECFEMPKT